MNGKILVLFFTVLFFSNNQLSFAQMILKEIPLKQQIEQSSLVIEGKVVSKKSFWDIDFKNIYTVNTIEVYKVFKGNAFVKIDVVTKGGTVGLKAQMVSPSLKLQLDDVGIFALYDSSILLSSEAKSSNRQFKAYGSLQGFYKYNINKNVAVNPFNSKKGISDVFYNEIMSFTKSKYTVVSGFDVSAKHLESTQNKNLLVIGITSFSPTTATAGTKTVLTIMGTDFGSKGKVAFSNADYGGGDTYVDALDTQILTWTTTEITVEIPSKAGTGKVRVTDASFNTALSNDDLTITSAQINENFEIPPGSGVFYAFPTRHVDNDGSGGYVLQMETSFDANSAAKTAFISALDTWRCETGINLTIGAVTEIDVQASDGINIIRFDNGGELDAGVLGQCTYGVSGCGSNALDFETFVYEMDVVLDDGENWYYGFGLPAGDQIDFESVVIHELGHAHMLGHVVDNSPKINNTNDVMYYLIQNGEQQRVLSINNLTTANEVQSRSESSVPICFGKPAMTTHPCSLGLEDVVLNNRLNIYPNPSKGVFYVKSESYVNLNRAVIYDISGRLISDNDISEGPSTKKIDLTGVSKGIYFVNIYSDDAMITKRLSVN